MRQSMFVATALALLAVSGCHRDLARPAPYRAVGVDNRALREAFNADVDKVRVVMLVSPS